MTNLQIVLAVVAYLLFSASALVATVKYFTMPYWSNIFNRYEKGLDVSWCLLLSLVVLALVPIANISMNLFWFAVLSRLIKRRLSKWPKCPVAIHGKKI